MAARARQAAARTQGPCGVGWNDAPAALRLAVGEWLDGCDGARLGRLACGVAPRPGGGVLHERGGAAGQGGLVVGLGADLAREVEEGSAPAGSPGVVVTDAPRRRAARQEARDWLWVALAAVPIAGLVTRDAPGPGWACLPARGTTGPTRTWRATPAAADRQRGIRSSGDRWGAARPSGPPLARGAGAATLAACDALERALRARLAAGALPEAVTTAARLAATLARQGAVVRADRLAACAEVAAARLGLLNEDVRRTVAEVGACREAAHRRAWRRLAHHAVRRLAPGWTGRRLERDARGGEAVEDELIEVFEAGHHEEEYPAIARVCSVVRDRLGASAVAVVALGEPTPLAGAGHAPLATDELLRRAAHTIVEIAPTTGRAGVEAAMPVRFAGAPVGVLCCRWGANAAVDPPRARTLLAAAASACAPSLHALLTRRPLRHDADQTLGLLGVSPAIGRVRDAIRRAAAVPFSVLVEGESGSGKELVARAIHEASPRQRRQFCAVNCAAISDELFEAEVFGHARGAFTGALTERAGLFEEADGGTLFLDEIGELSPRGQAKLLRVLQEGEVRRLGENLPRRVDVRLVAATNRSLEREARAGRFRDDLRFRLDVVRIALPPLRERREDVPLLAEHFWRQALARTGGRARLDEATLDVLARHDWPGNVRELQNLMATLAVKAPPRGRVRPSDLPFHLATTGGETRSLDEARRHFDASFVRATLERCGGRRGEAARALGLTRQGLAKLVARLGLDAEP